MKTTLYTILLSLCIATECMAEQVSSSAARQVAAAFLQSKGATVTGDAILASDASKARAANRQVAAETSPYYVFNAAAGQGFVIVSGDDCVGDNLVLGYADNGSFDAESVPENMQWWLSQTASQITELSQRGAKATAVAVHEDVPYLIKSLWWQGEEQYDPTNPYNAFCPEFDGKLSASGCMATALAQVMNYHKWPQGPIAGELPAYTMPNGRVMEALPPVAFDWNNILDDYRQPTTKEQQDAVATLMLYCGQMTQMNYAPEGSDALTFDRDMLVNLFGYDENMYFASSENYTVSDWDNLLYNELKEGRPIPYMGYADYGGHAFVLDGYAVQDGSGYYHVNWGWAGECNGYYKINLLNPSRKVYKKHDLTYDGFCTDQEAIIGLKPAENPPSNYGRYLIHYYWRNHWLYGAMFEAFNTSYKPGVFEVAMAELKEDGTPDYDNLVGLQTVEVEGFDYGTYFDEGTGLTLIDIPEGITESMTPGSHKMVFVNREAETNTAWRPIFGTHCNIEFIIDDDGQPKDTLCHPIPQLTCQEGSIKIEGLLQDHLLLNSSATIINNSNDDFSGYIDCEVFPVEDGILDYATKYTMVGIMIEGNGTSEVRFQMSVPYAGDYVVLLSKDGPEYAGTPLEDITNVFGYVGHKTFTVEELEFSCSDLSYDERSDENTQPAYYLDATLENNTPLNYDADLKAKIYIPDGEGGYDILDFCEDSYLSVPFQLASNKQEVVSIKLPEQLAAGDYDIDLYLSKDFNSIVDDDYFYFANFALTVSDPTGIKEFKGSKVQGVQAVTYNLSGQKVSDGFKGIVIKDGKKYVK